VAKEIECKYLVDVSKLDLKKLKKVRYAYQMYISNDPDKVVRVVIIIPASDKSDSILKAVPDITKAKAKFTIKGSRDGHTRDEYEYSIPVKDAARIMYSDMTNNIIRKIRVNDKNTDWDIDFNMQPNLGLVVAEKEYASEEELKKASIPDWAVKDMSNEDRFYNCNLCATSYNKFTDYDELAKLIWGDKEITNDVYSGMFDRYNWAASLTELVNNPPKSLDEPEEKKEKKDKGRKLFKIKFSIWKFKFKFSIKLMN
jgi:adenylate cyclase